MIHVDDVDAVGRRELNQTQTRRVRIEIGGLSVQTDCLSAGEIIDSTAQLIASLDQLVRRIHRWIDLATGARETHNAKTSCGIGLISYTEILGARRAMTNRPLHILDTPVVGVLHESPRLLLFTSSRTANPGEKGRAFCDRSNDSTRFAQPH